MDLQFDVLSSDGLGHAGLDAVLKVWNRLLIGIGDQSTSSYATSLWSGVSTRPSGRDFQAHAAAENPAAADRNPVGLRIGRGIDHDRALGQSQFLALVNLIAQRGAFPSARFAASSRRGDWSSRSARGRGPRCRSDRPSEFPAAEYPGCITSDTLPEASRPLGLATPRFCISSSSAARWGEGLGSLPVPCRPVTSPTASTRTGYMPVAARRCRRPAGRGCSPAAAPRGFATAWSGRSTTSNRPGRPRRYRTQPEGNIDVSCFLALRRRGEEPAMRRGRTGIPPAAGGANRTRRIVVCASGVKRKGER